MVLVKGDLYTLKKNGSIKECECLSLGGGLALCPGPSKSLLCSASCYLEHRLGNVNQTRAFSDASQIRGHANLGHTNVSCFRLKK